MGGDPNTALTRSQQAKIHVAAWQELRISLIKVGSELILLGVHYPNYPEFSSAWELAPPSSALVLRDFFLWSALKIWLKTFQTFIQFADSRSG